MTVHPALAARPAHIPEDLVIDFDMYAIPGVVDGYSEDIHALWKKVQDTHPDIFWTPRNGGHWIVTRYREIVQLCTEPKRFSSTGLFIPIGISPHAGPAQMDAPEHPPFRNLVAQAFTPANLNQASIRARAAAVLIIDQLKPRGHCNFMPDFASVMPIVTFLNLLGLPESEAKFLGDLAARMIPGQPGAEDAQAEAKSYVENLIDEREHQPTDDFVSLLVRAQVMGRDLTPEERHNVIQLVVTGGLDTVINMTSFAATYFARHPEVQRELRETPDLYDGAVEEIARMFGTSNLGRITRCDTELAGVSLRAGEQVLGVYPLAGLDERVNPDPMTFDPRRKGGKHLNFGSGPHICLGARLARREIHIFLEEWMAKMPEFHIAPGTAPRMSSGLINTMRDLYLEWEPG